MAAEPRQLSTVARLNKLYAAEPAQWQQQLGLTSVTEELKALGVMQPSDVCFLDDDDFADVKPWKRRLLRLTRDYLLRALREEAAREEWRWDESKRDAALTEFERRIDSLRVQAVVAQEKAGRAGTGAHPSVGRHEFDDAFFTSLVVHERVLFGQRFGLPPGTFRGGGSFAPGGFSSGPAPAAGFGGGGGGPGWGQPSGSSGPASGGGGFGAGGNPTGSAGGGAGWGPRASSAGGGWGGSPGSGGAAPFGKAPEGTGGGWGANSSSAGGVPGFGKAPAGNTTGGKASGATGGGWGGQSAWGTPAGGGAAKAGFGQAAGGGAPGGFTAGPTPTAPGGGPSTAGFKKAAPPPQASAAPPAGGAAPRQQDPFSPAGGANAATGAPSGFKSASSK
jgi:hypothetical protein